MVALLMAIVPSASASTQRPVRAALSGLITFEYDWADPMCPVTTFTEATGTMSHLGQVSTSFRHCPPITQPGYTDGHVVNTAANGDTLEGAYEDADAESPFVIEIVGGTGRFEGASGTLTLWFEAFGEWGEDGLPIEPWSISGVISGTISY
jgi:hypothetical protein